jgi:hypothetical protein
MGDVDIGRDVLDKLELKQGMGTCHAGVEVTADIVSRRWWRCALLGMTLILSACTVSKVSKAPDPATDQGACMSYGFVPGTDPYINCVRREVEARRTGKLGPTYDQILVAPAQ